MPASYVSGINEGLHRFPTRCKAQLLDISYEFGPTHGGPNYARVNSAGSNSLLTLRSKRDSSLRSEWHTHGRCFAAC